jgi:dolichol-phosphate mannosyltransferase
MNVVVLLPVYNEASRLDRLLERVRGALASRSYRVVAVDDGSEDSSPVILDRWSHEIPLAVVTHPRNMGLAQTLMDGLQWVAEHCADDDVIITMDADDTHDPAYIAPMLEKLGRGYDVVIASRFQPGAAVQGVPWHRQGLSYGVLVVLRVLMPIPGVRDYACGYRAIRAALIRKAVRQFGEKLLQFRQWGFICTAELLWRLHLVGARCAEVPFELRYDLKESTSRMRVLRTIAGYGLLIWNSRVRERGVAIRSDENSEASPPD